MDIGSLLLALALLLLVAAFVARPIVERAVSRNGAPADSAADDLIARREAVLVELRDLDFDQSTGKVSDLDYQTQRARLVAQGADILRALDQLPIANYPSQSADAEIERLIAARRKGRARTPAPRGAAASTRPGSFCPQCGQPVVANDKFCAHCGAKISIAEAAR